MKFSLPFSIQMPEATSATELDDTIIRSLQSTMQTVGTEKLIQKEKNRLVTISLFPVLFSVPDTSSCVTPYNKIGTCIPIRQCKYLDDLLIYYIQQPGVAWLLRNSQCGNRNSVAHLVCCPKTSATPRPPSPNTPASVQSFKTSSNFEQSAQFKCGTRATNSVVKVVNGRESELGKRQQQRFEKAKQITLHTFSIMRLKVRGRGWRRYSAAEVEERR
jgi:hypothetical protein